MLSLFHLRHSFIAFLVLCLNVSASLTATANPASQTAICLTSTACDGNVITPISKPTAGQTLSQSVPVQLVTGQVSGLSIPLSGDFQGFSIELSVSDLIFGENGDEVSPIFLNLMATVVDRSSRVLVRVGGNSQEQATVIPGGLPDGATIDKLAKDPTATATPILLISPNLVYAMGNISSLVNVDWFIGVPFNDTANPRTLLAEIAQATLGSHLVGMQLGNEPDRYGLTQLREEDYSPQNYFTEWGQVLAEYQNDANVPVKDIFVAPSVCCGPGKGGWTPEQVWDTGFLDQYSTSLSYIAVQHYPTNNCNTSGVLQPDEILSKLFLNHSAVIHSVQPYINSSAIAQGVNKPFIMFETNSASCGGFSGLSDSFAAALWAVDYVLNMASANFSHALFHNGGQSDFYNQFTPPPTNQSTFRQWTIGSTFYSTLVTAEALGRSNKAQVMDLFLNNNNNLSPGYAIYEDGAPKRLVFINYLTDPSGAANYTAYISIGGNSTNTPSSTPSSVTVKYLLAPSVAEKYDITWAGQTFGGAFESDGLLKNNVQTFTVPCDTANNVCAVTVPGPAVALVFLDEISLQESQPTATQTFVTTATTGTPSIAKATSGGSDSSALRPNISPLATCILFISGLIFGALLH